MYGQLIDLLDKRKVLDFSRTIGSERYVKSFDAWQHLLVMLYAVIKRLDSLREISASIRDADKEWSHLRNEAEEKPQVYCPKGCYVRE